jgi:hypothetical protein
MRTIKLIVPAAVLMGGFMVCTSSMYGTPEYAKKEKKSCTFCHAKMLTEKAEMAKNLNTTGTCYKDNDHSLAKCAAPKKSD